MGKRASRDHEMKMYYNWNTLSARMKCEHRPYETANGNVEERK